jgi:hypothetical protein
MRHNECNRIHSVVIIEIIPHSEAAHTLQLWVFNVKDICNLNVAILVRSVQLSCIVSYYNDLFEDLLMVVEIEVSVNLLIILPSAKIPFASGFCVFASH